MSNHLSRQDFQIGFFEVGVVVIVVHNLLIRRHESNEAFICEFELSDINDCQIMCMTTCTHMNTYAQHDFAGVVAYESVFSCRQYDNIV